MFVPWAVSLATWSSPVVQGAPRMLNGKGAPAVGSSSVPCWNDGLPKANVKVV
jgi:hypothetical protein